MGRPCASCQHPQLREINLRIKQGRPIEDIARWLATTDEPITATALRRHAKEHAGAQLQRGRRPVSGDFLNDVVAEAHDGLLEGRLRVTLKDGIAAQAELNKQAAKDADRSLMAKIALALSGHSPLLEARVIDPEVEALEAEFRPLLASGLDASRQDV